MNTRFPALALVPLLLAAPHALAAEDEPQPHTLTVSGEAEVKAVPDQAELSAGVVTQSATAADALATNSKAMNRVFATLKQLGIPEKSMRTSEFTVSPQYQNRNGNAERIVGYQVSNSVSVTIDDLARLGPAIDVLVGSGANSLGSVTFEIRDPKPLEAQARADAIRDAMLKAETYAKAAGLQLGPIVNISEGSEQPRPMFRAMAMAPSNAAPPIAAGEQSVSASVSVTFQIP
jgi:uncharacterized protein YggE